MKIAISSTEKSLDGNISDTFARCPYFVFVEIKDGKIAESEEVENMSANKAGGAGISAAQTVAEKNIEAVITANLGPRAADVLSQFDIKAYKAGGTVKEAVQKFIDGKLEEIK
ncbi:MAG: NifB/NifX family molybdenum-iron cluster-binding protein [Patescibacteria group bacterium]|nr:NifB/NifX family molybdenum-iron cluster-binding protein [Patescibacteria group bacterium]